MLNSILVKDIDIRKMFTDNDFILVIVSTINDSNSTSTIVVYMECLHAFCEADLFFVCTE